MSARGPARRRPRAARLILASLVGLGAGCDAPPPQQPSTVPLAVIGAGPDVLAAGSFGHDRMHGGALTLSSTDANGAAWVRWDAPPSAWVPALEGIWRLDLPLRATGTVPGGVLYRLVGPDGPQSVDRYGAARTVRADQIGSSQAAVLADAQLYLRTDRRPAQLAVEILLGGTTERDGRRRLELGDLAADGLLLLSGPERAVELPLPPVETRPAGALALHFGTRRLDHVLDDSAAHLVITCGSMEVARIELDSSTTRSVEHRVELDQVPTGASQLRFEVVGEAVASVLLEPRLSASQPEPSARPDLIVFLADTLRADVLTAYRGHPSGMDTGAVPRLDAVAADSLLFEQAWSSAAWTLPSHATLLTGLHPPEHGAIDVDLRLASDAPTLARHLRDAGYRTAAVSEGTFVSARHGLDFGFERFDEGSRDLDETLARAEALLEVDDGRPLFLFVQSYRVHSPYEASPAARSRVRTRVPVPPSYAPLEAALLARLAQLGDDTWPLPTDVADLAEQARALYLAGTADLDVGFDGFIQFLASRARAQNTVLAFTSDHGESFGEQGEFMHPNGVWESETRVPLFVRGPGITTGRTSDPAGLVDLAPTLALLAGAGLDPRWSGRDLLSPAPSGYAAFAWGAPTAGPHDRVAAMAGSTKLIEWVEDGRRIEYDLTRDPLELVEREPSMAALGRALDTQPRELAMGRPLLLEHDDSTLRELEAMGYITSD